MKTHIGVDLAIDGKDQSVIECKHYWAVSDWQNKYDNDPTNNETTYYCKKCKIRKIEKDLEVKQ